MANRDIYQLSYDEIKKILKNHSRATSKDKSDKAPTLLTPSKTPTPSRSRSKLGTMLEDMKTDILHSLALQMDIVHLKMKREEVEKDLVVFCHKCRRKHDKNQCPLDVVDVYGTCSNKHPTNKCPFLPPLKFVLPQESFGEIGEALFYMHQKREPPFRPYQQS